MSSSEESVHISVDLGDMSVVKPDVDKANADAQDKALEHARALIGRVISDRYLVVDLIAMGGMGAVYVGEHVHMHKRVAVKILHPESEDQPEIVARFEREALVGAHVTHPSIAHATDFGKLDDGSYFLILEYVDGKNLAEVIREGPMPAPRVARIGRELAEALGAAHALGIIHRDLKPRNVMLGPGYMPKLIDFGFAKVSMKKLLVSAPKNHDRPPSRLTGVGVVFGTINYLAPEAAHGMDAVDERADLYALGVILYEMLAGRHPFDSTDPIEMFNHHRATPPPPFKERAPSVKVPPELDAVVRKLLEKDPYSRYQSASEVIAAIDALPFAIEPISDAAASRTPPPPPARAPSDKPPKPPPPKAKADLEAAAAEPKAAKPKAKSKSKSKTRALERTEVPAPKQSPVNGVLVLVALLAIAAAIYFATR